MDLSESMNRLPKVLQNEIWEYVRGNREYWKSQFKDVMQFGRIFKPVRLYIEPTPIQVLASTKSITKMGQTLNFRFDGRWIWFDFLANQKLWIVVEKDAEGDGVFGSQCWTFPTEQRAQTQFYGRCQQAAFVWAGRQ